MDKYRLRAMRPEMEKAAVNMAQLGRTFVRSPLSSAAAGAGLGAAAGAGRAMLRKREPGEKRHVLRSALIGGAAGGALVGGASLGGKSVRDTMVLQRAAGATPTLKSGLKGTVGRAAGAVKDFGRSQVHGFTGKMEDSVGAGTRKKLKLHGARLKDELSRVADPSKRREILKQYAETQKGLAGKLKGERGALKSGITSIPGLAKGLAQRPGETGKALWDHSTGGGGRLGTALAVGLPTAGAAWDLRKGDESATGGRTIKQKIVRHGAEAGAGVLTGGLSYLPSTAVQKAVSSGVSRLSGDRTGRKKEQEKS